MMRFCIFEDELGALGNALGKYDHGAGGADRVRKTMDRLWLFGKVDDHGHTQENTLRATALFGSWLPRHRGTHGAYRTGFRVRRRFHVLRGFQSSRPQKSISWAMSSIPYSQRS